MNSSTQIPAPPTLSSVLKGLPKEPEFRLPLSQDTLQYLTLHRWNNPDLVTQTLNRYPYWDFKRVDNGLYSIGVNGFPLGMGKDGFLTFEVNVDSEVPLGWEIHNDEDGMSMTAHMENEMVKYLVKTPQGIKLAPKRPQDEDVGSYHFHL